MPNMGEYVVGAYLSLEEKCDGVIYNIKSSLWAPGELDVLGLRYDTMSAFLCEVTTHIDGLVIGNNTQTTMHKLSNKHARQREYAQAYLTKFNVKYMLWSPVVGPKLAKQLEEIKDLNLVINKCYTARVNV